MGGYGLVANGDYTRSARNFDPRAAISNWQRELRKPSVATIRPVGPCSSSASAASRNRSPMPTRRRALLILAALALLALASLVLALMVGSVHVPLGDVFPALFGGGFDGRRGGAQPAAAARAGRFACGGLLALAGALLQVLLRNPAGRSLRARHFGRRGRQGDSRHPVRRRAAATGGAAFVGALAAMLVVFGLAHGDGSWTQSRLLLTGVIVAAGFVVQWWR